jgi:DNA-binding PadR family transcriptional regulator
MTLTALQRDVLVAVAAVGPATGTIVRDHVDQLRGDYPPTSSLYRALADLEGKSLVTCFDNPADNRETLYRLTTEGHAVLQHRATTLEKAL